MTILRAGISDPKTAYFFTGQVLADLRTERPLGRVWLWSLPLVARTHGCAFVVFCVPTRWARLARRLLRRIDFIAFHLPTFVTATVDATDRTKLLRSNSLRQDVARINRQGFQFSISRDKVDLETFIRDYHDPYVQKVHGFDAMGMDFTRLLASCASGQLPKPWVLLKVELEGEWIAGGLLVSGADRAALMELGVRAADRTLVKRGALQALYWLSLGYLQGQGHNWINLMHARPFLRNGVLQYKLKFSPRLQVARPADGFLLLCDRKNDATREILPQEPFLVFKGDGLGAVWFSLDSAAQVESSCMPAAKLASIGITDIEQITLD